MSDLNIYQRINAVMKEVKYVQKDAQVQGYKAVTHDNVTAVLRESMVKHGIVTRVEQIKGDIVKEWETKSGSKFHRYVGDYGVSFVNIDNPGDCLTVTAQAHADDNADKAPGKAMSYATKYAMLKTFGLETGENEEGRYNEKPLYTEQQFEHFHDLVENKKAYELFLFMKTLTDEAQTALHNSFPEGKKSAGKKAVSDLTKEGFDLFRSVIDDLKEKIASQDISGALEVTDEMSDMEKRYVGSQLTDFEVRQLRSMREKAA